jgi:hypothetical protein
VAGEAATVSILLPPRRDIRESWSEWSEQVYGTPQQWRATCQRDAASRWVPHRCVVCRAGRSKGNKDLELNHLTYWFARKVRRAWTPKLFMVPLCHRCHQVETRLTRRMRRMRVNWGEHLWATLTLYLGVRVPIIGALWALWVQLGLPSPL